MDTFLSPDVLSILFDILKNDVRLRAAFRFSVCSTHTASAFQTSFDRNVWFPEHVQDLWRIQKECIPSTLSRLNGWDVHEKKPNEISVRMISILSNWLVEICIEWNIGMETFHHAIELVFRATRGEYRQYVNSNTLQLLGVVCLYIAWKMEEDEGMASKSILTVSELVFMCADQYTPSDVTEEELRLLFDCGTRAAPLGFDIRMVTRNDWLEALWKILSPELANDDTLYQFCNYLLVLSSIYPLYLKHDSVSVVAGVVILYAVRFLRGKKAEEEEVLKIAIACKKNVALFYGMKHRANRMHFEDWEKQTTKCRDPTCSIWQIGVNETGNQRLEGARECFAETLASIPDPKFPLGDM